jgi:hypothetical protein
VCERHRGRVRPQELELLLLPLLVPRHPRHGINWLILNQFSASATEAAAASTGLLSSDIVRLDEVWAHALTHALFLCFKSCKMAFLLHNNNGGGGGK